MEKTRIFYIDALKAFAILAVIAGHLPLYCYYGWNIEPNPSSLAVFVGLFHMPLFMLLSGLVTNVQRFSLAKKMKLLIPFFVFGLLFTYTMGSGNAVYFMTNEAKAGYWFLWVLPLYFLLLHVIRKLHLPFIGGAVVVQALLMVLHFYFRRTEVGTTLSTDHLWALWPFFSLGVILKNKEWQHWHVNKLIPVFAVLSIVLLITLNKMGGGNKILLKACAVLTGLPLCLFFLFLFVWLEQQFKGKTSRVKSMLKWTGTLIGMNTLQIYVIHYFLIMPFNLKMFGNYMIENNLVALEYLISPLLSVMIAILCVYISKILYAMRLGFVFGR